MAAVWQSLIPETPSMEPISIIIDDLQNSRSDNGYGPHGTNHYNNTTGNNLLSPPQYLPGSKHRNLSGCSNNNNTACQNSGNYLENNTPTLNSENLTNTTNSSNSSKSRGFQRISSSFNCGGEQFWRFYSDWRQRRLSREEIESENGKRNQERYFLKSGVYNTRHVNVFERTWRYIRDIFTTLVDARWRWTLFVFSTSYILSWIGFAVIWWLIVSTHGDLDHWNDPDWQPCIVGIHSFTSVFLFSLETQHTIGYGTRYMNDTCPDAIFVLVAQSVAGVLIEAFMVGVVFAKLSRPKKRANTLLFSKNAVISQRDGKFYFMFRVGDMRGRSGLFECHVRAQVITKRVTAEGEVIPIHQEEIKVGGFGEDEDRILFFWPTVIVHPIDAESPFYRMSPADLLKSQLEVIVVLEGVVESTGMTTQLRTSFLPSEILWGHRFHELSSFKTGHHVVFDFKLFNATFPVETPHVSACELDTERHHHSYGSLNGAETLPVSPQESLTGNNSSADNSPMRLRKKSVEVAIVNGDIPSRRLFSSAPIDSSDDDEEEEDSDNEESKIRTSRTRHESTSSLDSIVVTSNTNKG